MALKAVSGTRANQTMNAPISMKNSFPAMVKRWRELWQQGDFPFYYVQIAPYDYTQLPPYNSGGKYNSAYLRDAQRKSLNSNTQQRYGRIA
jgi:sialate O-acetylesterase